MKLRIALILASFCFSSCNTFVGLGRDIGGLGKGLENTAYGRKWDGSPRNAKQKATPPQTVAPH